MKIFDIGKELFSAGVYPGDPVPEKEEVLSLEKGDTCNLTRLSIGSHTGTHMDAPKHFIKGGKDISRIPLEKCVGPCKVVEVNGVLEQSMLQELTKDGTDKLLLKGRAVLTPEAAAGIVDAGLQLLGVETQTVGLEGITQDTVHQLLLGADVAILEGLRLSDIPEGSYFLAAQPLLMEGLDGSPVRPVLISF